MYKKGVSLTSLNPNETLRWQFAENGTLTSPAVSPNNEAVIYSSQPYNAPSHVVALSPAGALLWREDLPVDNRGNVEVRSVPRFSADSSTIYLGTVLNPTNGDNYSYLYAFDVGQGSQRSDPNAELIAYVTSNNRLIGTLTRNNKGICTDKFSRATNPSSITVKSNAGGSATTKVAAK